jgi:hypothetical protein
MKLTTIFNQITQTLINECVIAYINLDGKNILCKNRDRLYTPDIKIIHELLDNGIEICYMYDEITDYSEGINSNGLAIVNSALLVKDDEKEGKDKSIDVTKINPDNTETGIKGYDGLKIRTALSANNLKEALRSILIYQGKDKKDVGIKGFTMVSTPKNTYIIEATSQDLPIVTKIKPKTKVAIRTNHGIYHPQSGYLKGPKRVSSLSRYDFSKENLEKNNDENEILNILRKKYTHNFNNPYRRGGKEDMTTTSQLKMNSNNLTFDFRPDPKNSNFIGYENRLPKEYQPKIKVNIYD